MSYAKYAFLQGLVTQYRQGHGVWGEGLASGILLGLYATDTRAYEELKALVYPVGVPEPNVRRNRRVSAAV